MSKLQFAGRAKGDAKISELVLNDDISTQSSGTTTSSDQITRTVWESAPTTLSPALVGPEPDPATAEPASFIDPIERPRHVGGQLGHSPTSFVPPVNRLTRKTSPAYARVITASTTPMAQA